MPPDWDCGVALYYCISVGVVVADRGHIHHYDNEISLGGKIDREGSVRYSCVFAGRKGYVHPGGCIQFMVLVAVCVREGRAHDMCVGQLDMAYCGTCTLSRHVVQS